VAVVDLEALPIKHYRALFHTQLVLVALPGHLLVVLVVLVGRLRSTPKPQPAVVAVLLQRPQHL